MMEPNVPLSLRIVGGILALVSLAFLFDNELPKKIAQITPLNVRAIEIGFIVTVYGVMFWSLGLAVLAFRNSRKK